MVTPLEHVKRIESSQIDSLFSELHSHNCQWNCIFNAYGCPEVTDNFHRLAKSKNLHYKYIFQGTPYYSLNEASPYLISWNNYDEPFFHYLLNCSESWGFFVLGDNDEKRNMAHWQSLLSVLMLDGSISHLRFYSSRIAAPLLMSCTKQELGWFIGPYGRLLARDVDSSWLHFENPLLVDDDYHNLAKKYKPLVGKVWWQVTNEQRDAFSDSRDKLFRDNAVDWLWDNEAKAAEAADLKYGSLTDFVEMALNKASYWGLHKPGHRFALLSLYLHHGFDFENTDGYKHLMKNLEAAPTSTLRRLTICLKGNSR